MLTKNYNQVYNFTRPKIIGIVILISVFSIMLHFNFCCYFDQWVVMLRITVVLVYKRRCAKTIFFESANILRKIVIVLTVFKNVAVLILPIFFPYNVAKIRIPCRLMANNKNLCIFSTNFVPFLFYFFEIGRRSLL